jgi:hypothetical protein
MHKITYSIRIDADPEIVWIDQLSNGTLDRSYGPYWSIWSATNQINKWEACGQCPQGWEAV